MPTYHVMTVTGGKRDKTHTRRRRDAASLLFERIVYDIIKATAGLDTSWGVRAMDAAKSAMDRKANEAVVRVGPHTEVHFWRG